MQTLLPHISGAIFSYIQARFCLCNYIKMTPWDRFNLVDINVPFS